MFRTNPIGILDSLFVISIILREPDNFVQSDVNALRLSNGRSSAGV
jgi:hypothetical protein